MIKRLEAIIFYFESTCEICLANMNIEQYRKEVSNLMNYTDHFDDTVKMRLYYAYALIEYKVDCLENAYKGWQLAMQYAQKIEANVYLGKIYSYLAICCYIKGDKELENHFFSLSEEILKKQMDYEELASHYINILWFKRYEKEKKEVADYMDKAFDYVRLSGGRKDARIYLHLGYIYKTVFSDYMNCIVNMIKSNELCRKYGFVEMEAMTFKVLADVYDKIEKPAESIKIYNEIIYNEKFKYITANLKAAVLCNLVSCYMKMGDLGNAEKYLSTLSEVQPEVQTNIKQQYRALLLGLKAEYINLSGGDREYALEMIEESEGIFRKHKKNFVAEEFPYQTALRRGDIYLKLGEYEKAISSFRDMENIARGLGKYELKAAYEKLACVHEQIGDYRQSLICYKSADQVCGEIRNNSMDRQYETMYKEFIREVKEEEKDSLSTININLVKEINTDTLTNVMNRNFLSRYIEQKKTSPKRNEKTSVLMIDLDDFKEFNDNYGHIKGDQVLKSLAAVLMKNCRGTDKVVRYGGDEFLVIMEKASKIPAIHLAKKILEAVREIRIEKDIPPVSSPVTVSIGIASLEPEEGIDLGKMIHKADQALYISKNKGGNTYTHFDEPHLFL